MTKKLYGALCNLHVSNAQNTSENDCTHNMVAQEKCWHPLSYWNEIPLNAVLDSFGSLTGTFKYKIKSTENKSSLLITDKILTAKKEGTMSKPVQVC